MNVLMIMVVVIIHVLIKMVLMNVSVMKDFILMTMEGTA